VIARPTPTRAAFLIQFGILLALMLPVRSVQAQRGSFDMTIARKTEMKTVDGPEAYFTGKVTITGQFQRDEPSRVPAPSSISNLAPALHGTRTPPVRR
jgi:hypothetical protein